MIAFRRAQLATLTLAVVLVVAAAACTREVEVPVEVVKKVEVPVEVIREVEVTKEVEVPVEVIREVEVTKEVEVPVEVIREVEVPVEVVKEVTKIVEVIKEVEVPVEVIREVEVPVEVVKEVEVIKEVEVLVEVVKEVTKIVEVTPSPTPVPANSPTPLPTPTVTATPSPESHSADDPGPTGVYVPSMKVYDRVIPDLMEKWDIPGGAIAVVLNGKLRLARGYGFADVESEDMVQPDSLFRIASISKPITAVGILKLVEDERLNLDDRAFEILDRYDADTVNTKAKDPRVYDVTVRQLLQHSGGWDRDRSFDPMFAHIRVVRSTGARKPVSCDDTIRFMLGEPLDFAPGARYAYSNFGYCILGRIIEDVSGQSYEEYIKSQVLEPLGITRMSIGGTLLKDRAVGEVRYYGYPGQPLGYSALPDTSNRVPWHYGGFDLRTIDSAGGWVASPIDLVRFSTAVDGSKPPLAIEPETVSMMTSRPDLPLEGDPPAYYYGMGWSVRPVEHDANWWHDGDMEGTTAFLVRTWNGLTWAALFNSRPSNSGQFFAELDNIMWKALREVSPWPPHDLFPLYGYE